MHNRTIDNNSTAKYAKIAKVRLLYVSFLPGVLCELGG